MFENILEQSLKESLMKIDSVNDLGSNEYYVYTLLVNKSPIVLGHGRKNRAKVILDDKNNITNGHIKALFVRLYRLYSTKAIFSSFIIKCLDKNEAQSIESKLHSKIGGNSRNIPSQIENALFADLDINSKEYLLLKLAIASSYDGISDLRKWRREKLIDDYTWNKIDERLQLHLVYGNL